jgi:hypothetical protein
MAYMRRQETETTWDYAQRRVRESKRSYIITTEGLVFMDCPTNRVVAEEFSGIAYIIRPERRKS